MLGQIATFMENLHLTYREVVHEIPYRNLVVMSADKLHAVYDTNKGKGGMKTEKDVLGTFQEL